MSLSSCPRQGLACTLSAVASLQAASAGGHVRCGRLHLLFWVPWAQKQEGCRGWGAAPSFNEAGEGVTAWVGWNRAVAGPLPLSSVLLGSGVGAPWPSVGFQLAALGTPEHMASGLGPGGHCAPKGWAMGQSSYSPGQGPSCQPPMDPPLSGQGRGGAGLLAHGRCARRSACPGGQRWPLPSSLPTRPHETWPCCRLFWRQ